MSVEEVAPGDCQVVEGMTEPGTRRFLRFTTTTPNVGPGDLVVGPPAARPDAFTYSPCHGHHHFDEYADYRLWSPRQYARYNAARAADPAATAATVLARRRDLRPEAGRKAGFCMMDVAMYELAPPKYVGCDLQGISAGWADEYGWRLDGQYVDVTGLPAGTYVLEVEVNAERMFEESDYTDNRVAVPVAL
ncbi:MAG TPA: lysyl oxidase family protein [Mycobacteriales bacterium]|nr:lysyl oxidase family protein [Mycobacteriales bacterium]